MPHPMDVKDVARERPDIDGRTARIAAVLLVLVYTALAVAEMRLVDRTVDEPTYFNSGRIIRNEGWEHPLTRLHGPLPYYFNQLLVPDFPSGLYEEAEDPEALLFRGRLGLLPFGWLAAWVVFAWSRRLFGNAGGLCSLTLFALSPLMIGYSGLLAVDVAHTGAVLFVLYACWRFLPRPSALRCLGLGAALGIAFATKYLALLNGPVVVLLAAGATFRAVRAKGRRPGAAAGAALGAAVLVTAAALATLHACYGLGVGFAPTDPEAYRSELFGGLFANPVTGHALALFPRPFLLGVDYQMWVGEGTHFAPYLNGRFAPGHADYYLWVFLFKTPELVILLSLWLLVRRVPRWLAGGGTTAERTSLLVLLPPAAIAFGYLSLFTALQIGVRYVLPLYPMLFVLLGALATEPWVLRAGRRGLWTLLAVVAGLHAVELGSHWPNLIAYLNRSSGGPAEAWRHFNDSNADWGQLVRRGRTILEETEEEPFVVLTPLMGPRFGRVAVELRFLVRRDPEDPTRLRHWVLPLEAVRNVGAAWWLFDSTPEAWERALAAGADERVRADLVLCYLGAGRLADAERHLRELPEERAAPLRELVGLERERAEAAGREVGTLLKAIELWSAVNRHDVVERLLREEPGLRDHPPRRLLLGRAVAKQGRVDEAIAILEEEDFERVPRAALLLSRYYYVQERYREARALLEGRLPGMEPGLATEAQRFLDEVREKSDLQERFLRPLRSPENEG